MAGTEFYKNVTGNYWFSFVAYVMVIATWSALMGNDFISSSWKSVRDTRKRGIDHLRAVTLPMAYMPVYMFFQFKTGDYNEMNSGLVALMFALLHMSRTIWGLWQLQIFKEWFVASRESMMSLGYGMKQDDKGNDGDGSDEDSLKKRINKEADEVEVNDLIIDNRLTEGEVRCRLRFLSTEERKELERSPFLKRIGSQMWYTLRSALLLPLLLWSIVKARSKSRAGRRLSMEPKEPEEIWLRWATILVAHALPEWLSDMKKAGSGESQGDDGASYENVRDGMATEVLMSAALHSRKTGKAREENGVIVDGESDENVDRDAGHSFLSFEKWDSFPMLRKGTFNKQEFFRHACLSGKGLPFEIPHKLAKTDREGCAHYSYQKFAGKLNRARDDMPVDIGEKAIEFGVAELEWLAIFLSVGRWNSGVRNKQDNGSMDEEGDRDDELGVPAENLASQLGFSRGAQAFYDVLSGPLLRNTIGRVLWGNRQVSEVSAHSDKQDNGSVDEQDNGSVDEGDDRDDELGVPAENLASQLGFARGAQAFYDVLSGPLLRNTIGRVLWGNRQVSEVSAHIDNWMALCVGEQTAYVESKIPSVKKKCMVDHVEGTMDTEEVQEEPDEVEAVSNARFATENVWKENEDLERQRFLLQLTIVEPEFLHFDKSISFMGCSMENLRSSLATWAEHNENAAAIAWEPEIGESNGIELCASNDLQQLLVSLEGKKSLEERFVHMRLLWELQNHLQEGLPREGISPSQIEAMMLCVLSFPAICADVREWTGKDGCHGVSTQRDSCVIVVDAKSIDAASFNIENYEAVFRAVCGPQDVQVVIRFSRQDNGSAVSINAKLRVGESTSERFAWEAWRDAFGGRLAGAEKSKEEIGRASWSVCRTRRRISSGVSLFDASTAGTGSMRMWDGWLPTRSDISMYEMTSRGYIMKVQNSEPIKVETEFLRGTTTTFNFRTRISAPVSCADADKKCLKHASLIVVEVVRGFSESEEATNRSPLRVEDIRIRADRLMESGGKEDLDVALTLYEVAVTAMGDGDALGKALQILFQGGPSRKAAQEAVTLIEGFYMPRNASKLQGASLRSMRNQFRDEKWVALIDKQFEYVLNESMYEASVAVAYAEFCVVLSSFLKVGRRERAVAALARSIVHFSKISKGDYNFACSSALENTLDMSTEEGFAIAIARNENVMEHVDNLRDQMNTVGSRNQHRAAELYNRAIGEGDHVKAMNTLALLLEQGAEGVPANAHRAAELYNRAIEEGDNVLAMYNLANLLQTGAEGVPANAHRAAELYNRAIEEGDNVFAMYNLANLLKKGAEGVPANAHRAAELYNRAIEEGDDVDAMFGLANLLETGAEGVPANAHRAAELYNRAIEEGDNVFAMYNLANLLKKGAEGVPANAHRAAELYNRAIEEGDDVDAMFGLANLLETGAEGVPANAHRPAELYNRAIEEGDNVFAMFGLANLLETGAEGVPANAHRAAELYNRAIEEGDNVFAMYNLANLLKKGAEGVPANAHRAAELYNRAIEEGNHVFAMFGLANLLETGAEGVPANAHRAAELYNRAIEEGDNVFAMYNLANLLKKGAEGVPANAHRAAELYNRAIEEGDNVFAMYNLANLLKKGAEGVPANAHRAAELYNRAIEEGNHVFAMFGLANLLETGAEGVPANAHRAAELYNRAIEEGDNVFAMYNLANLLKKGAEGVPANAHRAAELYNRAIEEGDNVFAMYNLANLLEEGAEGVPANAHRAAELYNRAIEEGDDVYAMVSLAILLETGAEGVPANAHRAAELYNRAIEEGDNVIAMVSLANLLETGAEGVPANAHRAAELYNRAIEEGDHVLAMYNLANLLQTGAEGVPANAHRAAELYNRAIEEGDNVDAKTDLAELLHHGTNALEADPSRALELYTSVIETTGSPDAMYSLALLLHFGANGVSKESVRAHELYTRAMNEAGTGISYFNVRHLVDSGIEGLPAQPDRRVKLRTRGAAMYSLSKLLRDGADGIPADPVRAEQLLQSARSETEMSVLA